MDRGSSNAWSSRKKADWFLIEIDRTGTMMRCSLDDEHSQVLRLSGAGGPERQNHSPGCAWTPRSQEVNSRHRGKSILEHIAGLVMVSMEWKWSGECKASAIKPAKSIDGCMRLVTTKPYLLSRGPSYYYYQMPKLHDLRRPPCKGGNACEVHENPQCKSSSLVVASRVPPINVCSEGHGGGKKKQ